jgi:hypothetical protein
MAFLQEFSMDGDMAGQPPVVGAPSAPKVVIKSEMDKAVDEEAGDLELFHLLGDLADDVAPPASVSAKSYWSYCLQHYAPMT